VPIVFNGITVVTEEFVRDAHTSGLSVHVWTIDDRAEMEWLVDIGVDGIMTNHPTILEQVLAERDVRYETAA
jgi:glycerophosphoryl diester phosphodiesterase